MSPPRVVSDPSDRKGGFARALRWSGRIPMPSFEHEVLVELFRGDPKLLAKVMRGAFDLGLPEEVGKPIESTLTDLRPAEFRADLVVAFGEVRVIVEVQLQRKDEKRWTWPNYVTAQRARDRCRVFLLVVTDSERVAEWASEPIPLGNSGSSFVPLVLGPGNFPRLGPEVARHHPELAVLSTVLCADDEPGLEKLEATVEGLLALESERATIYGDLLLRGAGAAARKMLEAIMSTFQGYEYHSEFARKYWSQGREEGRVAATAEAVIKVLLGRGLEVSEAEEKAILKTTDLARLENWLVRALHVAAAKELLEDRA